MNSEFKTLSITLQGVQEQSQFSWSHSLNPHIDCYTIGEIYDSQQGKKKYHNNNDSMVLT